MPIYVVGAGPGDPQLLTLKAVELLSKADVVAFGDLVPEEIPRRFAPRARWVRIGHRRADHDAAVRQLVEEAKRGLNVVVLKNGDPTLFGRGLQICAEAERQGVPCEVVPGVPAFTAAAALYKVEITDGERLRHVAVLSYPHVTSEDLARVAADTVVIYMMGDRLGHLSQILQETCQKTASVVLCHSVSRGGGCVEVQPVELPKYAGLRPLTVIVKNCRG